MSVLFLPPYCRRGEAKKVLPKQHFLLSWGLCEEDVIQLICCALIHGRGAVGIGQGQLIDSEVVYFKKKLKSVFVRADIRTKGCRYVETVYNNE